MFIENLTGNVEFGLSEYCLILESSEIVNCNGVVNSTLQH